MYLVFMVLLILFGYSVWINFVGFNCVLFGDLYWYNGEF